MAGTHLLTAPGRYEAGAFDVRGLAPRPTALADLLRNLVQPDHAPPHPVLAGTGWWNRPIRLHHSPVPRPGPARVLAPGDPIDDAGAAPVLIVGGNGTLCSRLGREARHREAHFGDIGRGGVRLACLEVALEVLIEAVR